MTFTPKSGDVAYFTGCVEGGDPYRVAVAYQHATAGWHNIASGLRVGDDHPGLTDLHLLVRDGHAVTDAGEAVNETVEPASVDDPAALNMRDIPVAHLGSVPLVLSFEPVAIREHFDEDRDMGVFTDEQLATVGMAALSDDALYDAFHDALKWAMSEVQSNTSDGPATTAGTEPADDADLHQYLCTFEILSLIDEHDNVVGSGEIAVKAHNHHHAITVAAEWVRDNDYRYDERIDPRVTINDVTRKD